MACPGLTLLAARFSDLASTDEDEPPTPPKRVRLRAIERAAIAAARAAPRTPRERRLHAEVRALKSSLAVLKTRLLRYKAANAALEARLVVCVRERDEAWNDPGWKPIV
jgi:hypothetical protein